MAENQTNTKTLKHPQVKYVPIDTVDFDQFLRINIHAADYIKLEEILQTTPHHLTKLKNDPAIITDAEVQTLAPILRITPAALWAKVKEYSTTKK
jgi:hypothetical protein